MGKMAGVERCVVGYSGGKKKDPTYHNIMDHTEAVLVEFDPTVLEYEDFLVQWSQMHTPAYERKTQYRSAIFFVTKEQQEIAEEVVEGMKAAFAAKGDKVYSAIEPATRFYRAEEYHQDFLQKRGSTRWA